MDLSALYWFALFSLPYPKYPEYPKHPAASQALGKNQRNQRIILLADTAYAKAVESTVVSRAHIAAIEVHAVRVIIVVLCRRPIVAPHTGILQRPGRTATTDSGKLQLIGTVRFVD